MAIVMAIGIGGVFGAVARYAVSLALPTPAGGFPWATFIVNVSGSAALGFLLVLFVERLPRGGLARPIIGTGVIGAYTTFSTFEVDALTLVRGGHPGTAAVYVVASVIFGLVACWLGMTAVRALLQLERPARREA
jgi:CrcB protein